jgi:hypothetical protein
VTYVIIGVLAGLVMVWFSGYFTGRGTRLDRQQRLADVQSALDRSQRAALPPPASYGRFPVDTGPLLIVSELSSAGEAIGRDVRRAAREAEWLIEQSERLLPERRR